MLHGLHVDLSAMLAAREARALLQRDLLARFHVPLLSYTLNIPGPVKTSAVIRRAFDAGLDALAAALAERNIPCIAREERHEATGDEAILALRGVPEEIKSCRALRGDASARQTVRHGCPRCGGRKNHAPHPAPLSPLRQAGAGLRTQPPPQRRAAAGSGRTPPPHGL